jgi:putative membrane protein
MMYGYGSGIGVGSWILMGVGMLFFWAVVVTLVILLARRSRTGSTPLADIAGRSTALDILSQRFARGEIDEKEFSSRRRALLGYPE